MKKTAVLKNIPIYCWAAEDIPSFKANNNGYKSLTTSELLSIIIGSGTIKGNALELSKKLLSENGNSIRKISGMKVNELTTIEGIGEIKASKILAALELGNRLYMEKADEVLCLDSPVGIFNYMKPRIGNLETEEFWALYMNQKMSLIKAKCISIGGITETAVDIRILLKEAVLCNATVFAVCHNHPSGSIKPSTYDDQLTKSIKNASDIMRIHLLDHVIVTEDCYYSYKEYGRI